MKKDILHKTAYLVFAVLFLAACEQSPEVETEQLDPRLIGSWRSVPQEKGEGYNISETLFEYQDGQPQGVWDMSYKGAIRYAERFSETDGVIIVEYAAGGWPLYTKPGHTISAWVGTPIPGPFFGIYYFNLNDNTVVFANSTTLNSDPPYKPPETTTLAAAKAKFTRQNRSLFVASVALPQTRWKK
ncbi:MAG: hypothetical protein LBK61_07750 [Spirochaetaceae bacterium]|jgi:hypothetical protein|nr:hypothetical protein [Spirochaetaceae bacterium]